MELLLLKMETEIWIFPSGNVPQSADGVCMFTCTGGDRRAEELPECHWGPAWTGCQLGRTGLCSGVWICNWWIMLRMHDVKKCEWVSDCTLLWKDAYYLNKHPTIMCLAKNKNKSDHSRITPGRQPTPFPSLTFLFTVPPATVVYISGPFHDNTRYTAYPLSLPWLSSSLYLQWKWVPAVAVPVAGVEVVVAQPHPWRKSCPGHLPYRSELVSWCFQPSQPQRVTSGMETDVHPSPTYCAKKLWNCKILQIHTVST